MKKFTLASLILLIILNITACRGNKDSTQQDIKNKSAQITSNEESESIITTEEQVTENETEIADLYGTTFDDLTYTLGGDQTIVHYPSTAGLVNPIINDNSLLEFTGTNQQYHVSIKRESGNAYDELRNKVTRILITVYSEMSYDDVADGKTCLDVGAELEELVINDRTVYKITYSGAEDDDGYKAYVIGYGFDIGEKNIVIVGYTNNTMLDMFNNNQDDYIQYINDLTDYLINNLEITE